MMRPPMPDQIPLHGLAPEIISMIRGEIEAAIAALNSLRPTDDDRRIAAVMVMLEEVQPEFEGHGRKPWRAVPWLDCASQLLQYVGATTRTNGAREHLSAARDLLARD
jgi:hypothetical protein